MTTFALLLEAAIADVQSRKSDPNHTRSFAVCYRPHPFPGADQLAAAIRAAESLGDTEFFDCLPTRTHCVICQKPLTDWPADATGMAHMYCADAEMDEPTDEDWEEYGAFLDGRPV